ncbi:MAG: UDP-3-O-(3-hydroxymyristoyl)glucosamine N-acyltransferase [Halieaceae bacterium]
MPTLGDAAEVLGLAFRGDPSSSLDRLAPISQAGVGDLSFIAQKKFAKSLVTSKATAVICPEAWVGEFSGAVLFSEDPYADFARATRLFDNRPSSTGRIDSDAVIAETAQLGANVTVDAGAVIAEGASVGDNAWVGPNAWVGDRAKVGSGTQLCAGVAVYHNVVIGEDCLIHANTVIGSDGFGFAPTRAGWEKILQLGSVIIGDRVEIGAGCAIDRGALEDTKIADDVIIDNLVHIAHGVEVGRGSAIAGQVGFAGGTELGERCTVGGQAGFAGHLKIANDVHIGGQGRVSRDVNEAGHYASGTSLMPVRDWARNAARYEKLSDMAKRIDALEKLLSEKDGKNQ